MGYARCGGAYSNYWWKPGRQPLSFFIQHMITHQHERLIFRNIPATFRKHLWEHIKCRSTAPAPVTEVRDWCKSIWTWIWHILGYIHTHTPVQSYDTKYQVRILRFKKKSQKCLKARTHPSPFQMHETLHVTFLEVTMETLEPTLTHFSLEEWRMSQLLISDWIP